MRSDTSPLGCMTAGNPQRGIMTGGVINLKIKGGSTIQYLTLTPGPRHAAELRLLEELKGYTARSLCVIFPKQSRIILPHQPCQQSFLFPCT